MKHLLCLLCESSRAVERRKRRSVAINSESVCHGNAHLAMERPNIWDYKLQAALAQGPVNHRTQDGLTSLTSTLIQKTIVSCLGGPEFF
jgi:hypothetical protein